MTHLRTREECIDVVSIALADAAPQEKTVQNYTYALALAQQGLNQIEIRDQMIQAELITLRNDVANALTQQNATMQAFMVSAQEQNQTVMATLAKQNELMMATWKRQDAMEARFTDYLAQQQKSDQAFRIEQENRIKQLEERPATTEIVNNSISVHVEGDVKGVLNIEASSGKTQGGAWWVVAFAVIFIVCAYAGRIQYDNRAINPDSPPKNCSQHIRADGSIVCREDL